MTLDKLFNPPAPQFPPLSRVITVAPICKVVVKLSEFIHGKHFKVLYKRFLLLSTSFFSTRARHSLLWLCRSLMHCSPSGQRCHGRPEHAGCLGTRECFSRAGTEKQKCQAAQCIPLKRYRIWPICPPKSLYCFLLLLLFFGCTNLINLGKWTSPGR